MSFLFPSSPMPMNAVDGSWTNQPVVYLVVAAICLVIALRFLKRALVPIGALVQAVAAAAIVAFTAVLALALLIMAAFTTLR